MPNAELGAEALLAAVDEPISVFDQDGVYIFVNPAGLALVGRTLEQLRGRNYLHAFPELADHPFHHAFMRVANGTSRMEHLEFFYEPMKLWSSQRMYRAGTSIVVFWENITERKAVEARLELALTRASTSEQMFRTMIEGMPQLAWIATADGYIDYYNPRWYEFTGTTPAEMEGWGWQSVHRADMLPLVMQQWSHSVATGEPFEMEFPLRSASGSFRWFLTRVAPLRDETGRVVRWVGSNTDIDDQRRAIEQLDATLESMSDGFVLLGPDWTVLRVNGRQEALSGRPRAETVGRNFWDLFPAAKNPESKYWGEYHRVMEERVDAHFVEHYPPQEMWTEIDAFPAGDGGVALPRFDGQFDHAA